MLMKLLMNIMRHTRLLVRGPNCVRTCPTGVSGTRGGRPDVVVLDGCILVCVILVMLTDRAVGPGLLFVPGELVVCRLRDLTMPFPHPVPCG